MFEYKQFYRRRLPHIHSPNGTLFVTFRLANSIPRSLIARYKNEKQIIEHESSKRSPDGADLRSIKLREFHRNWFRIFEDILDKETTGPLWLKNDDVAATISESLLYRNGKDYDLKVFCIMSTHVHAVFKPYLSPESISEVPGPGRGRFESSQPPLGAIMHSLKGYTARKANKLLGRSGQFWEVESYDHEVRNSEDFARIVRYVLQNPVKANLVDDWRQFKWTWLAESLQEYY